MKNILKTLSICVLIFVSSCKEKTINEGETSISIETVIEANDIDKVEPPHWWIGFKNQKLQLLVKHPNIGEATPEISHSGVTLEKFQKADSPNYLFLDLVISESAKAGKFNIIFKQEKGSELVETYELKSRKTASTDFIGFNSSDVIYLITPDRFSNGNPSNDIILNPVEDNREASTEVTSLLENSINRNQDYARHGGDINGITNHLDYIDDMGFTAIWPGPMLINDMPKGSYHGYAITDYYKVDPRFGTTEEYIDLANKAKSRNIKLIMDQVANHCGLKHWWMRDLPFKDWINFQENYEKNIDNWTSEVTIYSNHKRTTNQDIYASKKDYEGMADGWFVSDMPDLNQRNPFMANYIIQNSIWWIETLDLGGIRQDTYPYPDKDFMNDWTGAIMEEYPNFNIVGEEWSYNPLLVAYWQKGNVNKDGYKSNLRSTMDFPMQKHIVDALNEGESWDKGLVKIYEGLANDFAYVTPKDIMIFPDNHDMSRIFTQLKGDVENTKMALSYLLMLPRIPQIYYGTEILMDDFANPGDHGLIRTDFPGGWEGDAVNVFTGEGLTAAQKDMQSFLKKVLRFRKTSEAIHDGETKHFAPLMGTYFLYRTKGEETVVHIINKNEDPIEIDLKYYEEMGLTGKTLKNVITGENMVWGDSINLSKKGSLILTTKL